jgi:hypothetical protein
MIGIIEARSTKAIKIIEVNIEANIHPIVQATKYRTSSIISVVSKSSSGVTKHPIFQAHKYQDAERGSEQSEALKQAAAKGGAKHSSEHRSDRASINYPIIQLSSNYSIDQVSSIERAAEYRASSRASKIVQASIKENR